jgi:hypothetical protein
MVINGDLMVKDNKTTQWPVNGDFSGDLMMVNDD